MPPKSTLPEIDDNNAFLSEEEDALSSGNKWLAIIVGVIFLLATVGYFMPGEGGRSAIASVMPSVMLGEASVMGAREVEEPKATKEVDEEEEAPEAEKPVVAEVVPRRSVRPAAEPGLDSRMVQAVAPVAAPEAATEAPASVAAPAAPTSFTLTGKILDENGRPLAGATVLLRGSRKGTGTDANGNYSLEVPTGDNQLVYGYGGYQDQEVRTRGSQPVNVTLLPTEGAKRRRN
ncbi:carboxypeptidase-like regulatory domain-containing protein [Hymenobacter tibetensis]|uniref:Carboxypeptidase-like regulatory domain-containing protein n=1 Tax=Hymenobacter tibetensis TaxID=497967 RepID=A0ABY4D3A4_9BACT|nr:carboxypeptidase-like regulatory domain-containing protein [Hymenobacter tibetensis]UOG76895.1 carboxypeptidase-like regulatory domain-containing protein [Hymenobacter tibetensis]